MRYGLFFPLIVLAAAGCATMQAAATRSTEELLSAAVTQYAFTIAAVGTQLGALVLGSDSIAYLQAGAIQVALLYIALVVGLITGYAGIRTAAQIAKRKAA